MCRDSKSSGTSATSNAGTTGPASSLRSRNASWSVLTAMPYVHLLGAGRSSVWSECCVWDAEAAGSNPAAPTGRGAAALNDVHLPACLAAVVRQWQSEQQFARAGRRDGDARAGDPRPFGDQLGGLRRPWIA